MTKPCKNCGTTDSSKFRSYVDKRNGNTYLETRCRGCINQDQRDRRALRKAAGLPSEYKKEYHDRYRKKHKERLKAEKKIWYKKNKLELNQRCKEYQRRLKYEVLYHYSGGTLQCNCCGESIYEFLTLDHINGLDEAEKKTTWHLGKYYRKRSAGSALYSKLRSAGYPAGFQILCWNCNCSKGLYGCCPHTTKVKISNAA